MISSMLNRGIAVSLDGDRLKVEPASRLTPADRQWLAANRNEVIARLRALPATEEVEPAPAKKVHLRMIWA